MKRTLAIALVAGALLLGGCSRTQAGASSTPAPAPASSPAATAPAHRTSGTHGGAAAPAATATASDDVSDLLDQVDKQLQTNDQPSSEQD